MMAVMFALSLWMSLTLTEVWEYVPQTNTWVKVGTTVRFKKSQELPQTESEKGGQR